MSSSVPDFIFFFAAEFRLCDRTRPLRPNSVFRAVFRSPPNFVFRAAFRLRGRMSSAGPTNIVEPVLSFNRIQEP